MFIALECASEKQEEVMNRKDLELAAQKNQAGSELEEKKLKENGLHMRNNNMA